MQENKWKLEETDLLPNWHWTCTHDKTKQALTAAAVILTW